MSDITTMAQAVAKSNLFGIKSVDQALALMFLCQAEGLHPMVAARDYHIIEGRPSLKADAMLARFQQSGGKVSWSAMTDDAVVGTFSHPQGGEVVIDWTMARAKTAQLGGKGNWVKYPRQMLRARVISEGIRATYPACCGGVYTPEEVADFDDRPSVQPRPVMTTTTLLRQPVVVATLPPAPAPSEPESVPAFIALLERLVEPPAPTEPEPAAASTPAVDEMLKCIAACRTAAALKAVAAQIKRLEFAPEQATELRKAFKERKQWIASIAALEESDALA